MRRGVSLKCFKSIHLIILQAITCSYWALACLPSLESRSFRKHANLNNVAKATIDRNGNDLCCGTKHVVLIVASRQWANSPRQ